MPRALFLTNQFFSFAGAELTVLELAEELASRGWECVVKAAIVGAPMSLRAFTSKIEVSELSDAIDVNGYNIVWCQHGTLANIDFNIVSRLDRGPYIISAHLSPFLDLENVLHPYTSELADLVVANSAETASTLPSWLNSDIVVNANPAPDAFFVKRNFRSQIQKVLCISNHVPAEMTHVLLHLERNMNIEVNYIGYGSEYRRIRPSDITAADVVITIGKSVQYAIASQTPAYIYDHFGGDGWLTPHNIYEQAIFNFSGRPNKRRLTSDEILKELMIDYNRIVNMSCSIHDDDIRKYRLSTFVDDIISRSSSPRFRTDFTALDERVMTVATLQTRIRQNELRQKYRIQNSDMWSQPSLDMYFARH